MRPLPRRHLLSLTAATAGIIVSGATVLAWNVAPLHARQAAVAAGSATAPASASASASRAVPPRNQFQAAAGGATAAAEPASEAGYNVARATPVRSAPEAALLGQLRAGATVQALARSRGWVRVRIDGWVPEADLTPADSSFRSGMSAADVRSDPSAARGKVVQWTVEFIALQTADPLRHGLADEEPYILARGPSGENALLYMVVPPSLMGTARALEPLAKVAVTARVREGRSEPVGIPILDLQTIRRVK